MFIKQKILTAITKHPRIFVLGIGIAVIAAVTLAMGGVLVPQSVYASGGGCYGCYVQ